MGRPRTPTTVLELRGAFAKNPKRGRERAHEPAPPAGLGRPPKYFDAADRACWRELERVCERGVCTRMDRPKAELAARLWAQFRRGELDGRKTALLSSLLGLFGCSPSERSKVHGSPLPASAESAALERRFFGGKRA